MKGPRWSTFHLMIQTKRRKTMEIMEVVNSELESGLITKNRIIYLSGGVDYIPGSEIFRNSSRRLAWFDNFNHSVFKKRVAQSIVLT